jgi:D-tagatose-1,6-bisphosphate aldolase subunit GatZ/KbaZ
MYLDEIVAAQKRGEARGIPSVCSAHPYVLRQTLKVSEIFSVSPLIEATCNQVNQFGGYTGMTPVDFVRYVRGIAQENQFPFENIILGGDHLGPSVWQAEPADIAMEKAEALVRDYVEAGFVKIHLDCSMRLADDPQCALDVEVSAKRAAKLAKIAENSLFQPPSGVLREERGRSDGLRYVIGTEVPIPGGATEHEESVRVTKFEDVQQTIEVTREAFYREGLQPAWERVMAIVVQPGVEFGDDFILPYRPVAARELSQFIESQPMIFEAHSTDYQTYQALEDLVRDHFAILKVGPALTFAFREAVFALAMMENELFPSHECSNIISVLDEVMVAQPGHWVKYYHGDEREKAFKRKYSLSDRIRYYWTHPMVRRAFEKMLINLKQDPLPGALLRQYVPDVYRMKTKTYTFAPKEILLTKIQTVLDNYAQACNPQYQLYR